LQYVPNADRNTYVHSCVITDTAFGQILHSRLASEQAKLLSTTSWIVQHISTPTYPFSDCKNTDNVHYFHSLLKTYSSQHKIL